MRPQNRSRRVICRVIKPPMSGAPVTPGTSVRVMAKVIVRVVDARASLTFATGSGGLRNASLARPQRAGPGSRMSSLARSARSVA